MKHGKFKKITAIGLALTMAVGLIYSSNVVKAFNDQVSQDNDGLELFKSATYDPESQEATITLDAYTTGEVTVETEVQPTDIVIIADQSQTMFRGDLGGTSKKDAARTVLKKFAGSVSDVNSGILDSNNKIRLSLIAEKGDESTLYNSIQNKGFKSKENKIVGLEDEKYLNNALTSDMNRFSSYIEEYFNGIEDSGSTEPYNSFAVAKMIFEKSNNTNRKQIVLYLSDAGGVGDFITLGEEAVSKAYELKHMNNPVEIYTVGIFTGADGNTPAKQTSWSSYIANIQQSNTFMHFLSSNYPDVKGINNVKPFNPHDPLKYYMSATDAGGLQDVFDKIKNEVVKPTVPLGKETVIKDIVSDYFELPEEFDVTSIGVATADFIDGTVMEPQFSPIERYYYPDSDGNYSGDLEGIHAHRDGKTISIDGYDFDKNCLRINTEDGSRYGKKLSIQFKIKLVSGFIGGDNIPTNTDRSGIYENTQSQNPITVNGIEQTFDIPHVDVPTKKINVLLKDDALYAGNNKGYHLSDLFDKSNSGNIQYTFDNDNVRYELNGFNNEFVDIDFDFKILGNDKKARLEHGNRESESLNDLSLGKNLNDCEQVILETRVSGNDTSSESNTMLHLYVPTISLSDKSLLIGEKYDMSQSADVQSWNDKNNHELDFNVENVPELSYEFNGSSNQIFDAIKAGEFKNTVCVYSNGVNITDYSQFDHDGISENKFIITVDAGQLTINKTLDDSNHKLNNVKEDAIFGFKIEKKDNDGKVLHTYYKYIRFARDNTGNINGNTKSVTLSNLSVGTYIVTELDTNRYDNLSAKDQEIIISSSSKNKEVSFTNQLTNDQYLSDNDIIVNEFGIADDGSVTINSNNLK